MTNNDISIRKISNGYIVVVSGYNRNYHDEDDYEYTDYVVTETYVPTAEEVGKVIATVV